MKTQKIGEVNLGKFSTTIYASEVLRKKLKSKKISEATLVPAAWVWYDAELLELLDENGDGKIDERFGKDFEIIYLGDKENVGEYEKDALGMQRTAVKDLKMKYVIMKGD
jgi:hypothetical protein